LHRKFLYNYILVMDFLYNYILVIEFLYNYTSVLVIDFLCNYILVIYFLYNYILVIDFLHNYILVIDFLYNYILVIDASRKRKAIDLDTTYAESIFLQQNHRSKNIIICQKITKHLGNKTVTHHLNFLCSACSVKNNGRIKI
jgi:hypothetical protein